MAELVETLIFEHDGTNVPVEILETRRGSRFVAVDYHCWNKLTGNYSIEQHDAISCRLHRWFEYEGISVDKWHPTNIDNKNAPIYWLLDDSD
jgi:hypothetical protein